MINLSDLDVDYLKNIIPKTFKDSFVVRNIRDDEAFTNLAKISPMGIKDLQYIPRCKYLILKNLFFDMIIKISIHFSTFKMNVIV